MIRKIVSGGQTGADQAALDVAIKLGIPHGGWLPAGRRTEAGPLAHTYNLREMATAGYAERTEQNVLDSDGTLILSHGELSDGSEYTRTMAIRHQRPWLHIDLERTPAFAALQQIVAWIREHAIEVLNVAGPRASQDPRIYHETAKIMESVCYYETILSDPPSTQAGDAPRPLPEPPQTVEEAVARLLEQVPLKDRTLIANMTVSELAAVKLSLNRYIQKHFGLWIGNPALMASCRFAGKTDQIDEDQAVDVIIRAFWEKLRRTHALRRIK
jgi:Circularly permutated YpsA SLOG family/Domain of unknown function (DUF6794)